MSKAIVLLCFTAVVIQSCGKKNPKEGDWYEDTKAEILRQSDFKADSTNWEAGRDIGKRNYYSDGHLFMLEGYRDQYTCLRIYYSLNNDFELRREICENGTIKFEGIAYKSDFYGLSTWYHCNKKLQMQGFRFKSSKIGIWKQWDENNKLTVTDYGGVITLDSMPILHPSP